MKRGPLTCLLRLLLVLPLSACLMGASLWTPASPGAPAAGVWLDGADASTLTTNPSNPAQVLGWRDKSGQGDNASADPSYAPSLNSLNGQSTLDFGPVGYGTTANPHMFMASRINVQTVFIVWGSSNGGGFMLTDTTDYPWHRSGPGAGLNASDPIFDATSNFSDPNLRTGDADARLNGTLIDPTSTGLSGNWDLVSVRTVTNGALPFNTLSLDRTFRSGGQGIAELIAFPGRLSVADVQRMEGYLAWKWGLQAKLASNHPYKAVPPTVPDGNLIVDGSFESGNPANGYTYAPTNQIPWVFVGAGDTAANSAFTGGIAPPPDGSLAAFVQTNGSLTQTFNVPTSGFYALSFQMAQRANYGANQQTLSIQMDGAGLLQVSQPNDAVWHAVSVPSLYLGAGSHTLRFQGLATADATDFIDDVQLTNVPAPTAPVLVAELRLEEGSWSGVAGEAADSSGAGHPGTALGSPVPVSLLNSSARPGNPGTCAYASLSGGAFDVPNLPVSTTPGDRTTVMFWMYWNGVDNMMPMGWAQHDLWLTGGFFGFNTAASDVYGISSAGLANGWHHVAAVFVNGNVAADQLFIDGVNQTLTQLSNSPDASNAVADSTLRIGGWTRDGLFRFGGFLDEFRVYTGAAAASDVASAMAAGHPCGAGFPPSGFNAFESVTAAGATTGVIHTKVAGASFSVDVVALNASPASIRTDFIGSVKVEILDASNNSGAVDANGCRSTWGPVTSGASVAVNFGSGDAGRKTVTLVENEAWRDLRLRITTPASGTPLTVGCSTDDFANRPASFTGFSASDGDAASAGTARSLANTGITGGVVHKAGRPFTVQATAVNAIGNPTANYAGTPKTNIAECAGAACNLVWTRMATESNSPAQTFTLAAPSTVRYGEGVYWATQVVSGTVVCNNGFFGDPAYSHGKECDLLNFGALALTPSAVAGVINQSASYSETGAFALQLVDSSFAAVDSNDNSTPEESNIVSPVINVGRFVPDHFDVQLLAAPVLRTFDSSSCGARSFTYVGQPFGYASAPQASVLARNAAGATTAGYAGVLWKLDATGLAQVFASTGGPALDSSATTAPTLTANGDGTGLLVGNVSDKLRYDRSGATPSAPFGASIALSWSAQDASEAGMTGNGTIGTPTPLVFPAIAFDAGNQFRFGMLRLQPAYGSELVNLPVLMEAQYWDGQRMATNAADQCTSLPANAVALGNYQRSLAACKTALGSGSTTLSSGRGYLRLAKPGTGNAGSVDLALQLGSSATGQSCITVGGSPTGTAAANLPWLQGKWNGASAFDQNPSTRASFGQYRSPLIYVRESF